MVIIKNFFGTNDIKTVTGTLTPGELNHPVQICSDDTCFSAVRMHVFKTPQLFKRFFLNRLGHFRRFNCLPDVGQILFSFVITQLALNGLHLLTQIIFLVVFTHLLTCGVLYLGLYTQQLNLAVQKLINLCQADNRVIYFQQCLSISNLQPDIAGDQISHAARILDILKNNHHFRRNLFAKFHNFGQLFANGAYQRLRFK